MLELKYKRNQWFVIRMAQHTTSLVKATKWNLPSIKQFARDYILPLSMTIVFLLSVASVAYVRANEKVEIAELPASSAITGQDYAKLLSGDKQDNFSKNAPGSDVSSAESRASTPTEDTFTIDPGSEDGSPSTGGGTNGGGSTTPAPFSASALDLVATTNSLQCSTPKFNKNKCSKTYSFAAHIRTFNGPGQVSYNWQSNVSGASSEGGYSAGSGTVSTPLGKEITVQCNQEGTYNLQLLVSSPSSVRSNVISFAHSC